LDEASRFIKTQMQSGGPQSTMQRKKLKEKKDKSQKV
jgi:hypothetical protein